MSGVTVEAARHRLEGIPFVRSLGLVPDRVSPDGVRTVLARRPWTGQDEGAPALCEGLVAAAADQAASVAVWGRHGLSLPHATVTLSLDFIAPVASDRVFFETRLVGEHQGIGHVETRVLGDGGELFALGAVDFALGSYPGDAGPSTTAPVEDPGFLGDAPVEPFGGASVTQALGLAPRGDSLAAPYRANLVGSRTPIAWHGGAIAAASVCAARHLAAEPSARLFQITVNYLRSGLGREAVFAPEIISRTRRALLIETSATQDAGDRLVARSVLRFQRL